MKRHILAPMGGALCGDNTGTTTTRPDIANCARCKKKLQSAMRKRQRVDVTKLAATRR